MSADFATYPTGAHVEAMFRSTAFWPEASDTGAIALARFQAENSALAAASEWETRVGWGPFLAPSSPETRFFESTSHRGELDLRAGLVELHSLKVLGREISVDLDRQTKVGVGGAGHRVVTRLRLGQVVCDYGYSKEPPIEVTGIWGACQVVPEDVWAGILQRGALTTLQQIQNNPGIASLSQAGFSLAFDPVGVISPNLLLTVWGKDFPSLAALWKRVIV